MKLNYNRTEYNINNLTLYYCKCYFPFLVAAILNSTELIKAQLKAFKTTKGL